MGKMKFSVNHGFQVGGTFWWDGIVKDKNVFIKIKNCYIKNTYFYICKHNARKLFF